MDSKKKKKTTTANRIRPGILRAASIKNSWGEGRKKKDGRMAWCRSGFKSGAQSGSWGGGGGAGGDTGGGVRGERVGEKATFVRGAFFTHSSKIPKKKDVGPGAWETKGGRRGDGKLVGGLVKRPWSG